LLLPHADYVKNMLDKLSMITLLSEKKIPVPFSRSLGDEIFGINFPCISKPRRGRGSRDVRVLNSIEDAIALKSTLGPAADKTLIQDKVEGIEYTVQMVADASANLCAIVPVKVGIKRGITILAETEVEARVIKACRAIHQALPTVGCYNIQLMLTARGQALPFEINPRVSTTLCLVVAAGVDPIGIFLDGIQSNLPITFTAGIQLRRHWVNHISNK
jgi:carbamoyl-phosphate synthase large subunit